MDQALAFVVAALAVWTISSLLVHERGPYAILQQIRDAFGVTPADMADGDQLNRWQKNHRRRLLPSADSQEAEDYDEDVPECIAENEVGLALCCIWCTSLWVSLGVSIWLCAFDFFSWPWLPGLLFGLRTASILIDEFIYGAKRS